MTNTVGTVDMTIIGLYFLLLLGVGLYAGCKIKTMEDYAVAGRRLGYPILLGTLIGTAIGAGSTIGQTGKAYTYGVAFFFVAISYGVGLIAFSFLAPVLRRTKIWTIPDALVLRYGSSMRWISAVVIFFAVIALYGAHLIAMGTTVSILLGDWGITFGQAVVVAGLIMVIYTILGGLLAVAYTDFLQAIIMLVGIGLVLPWCIAGEMGGLSGVWAHIKPEAGNFWKGLSPAYLIGVWVTYISINLIEPSLWQRASAAKNDRMLKRSLLITGGVYFYWSVVGAMLGATAAYLYPELGASAGGADASVPMHIARFLPPALKGLCLAALMAAIMSTADTFLLIAGTTFSHNLVGGIRPHTSGKTPGGPQPGRGPGHRGPGDRPGPENGRGLQRDDAGHGHRHLRTAHARPDRHVLEKGHPGRGPGLHRHRRRYGDRPELFKNGRKTAGLCGTGAGRPPDQLSAHDRGQPDHL